LTGWATIATIAQHPGLAAWSCIWRVAVAPDLYRQHHDVVERALATVCRRHHLTPSDAEDVAADFRVHLLEDDGAILRKFQGRSSMQTYLVSVIVHFFQDWRNAKWGKWRPSAEAKRLGPVAVQLETLIVRDQLPMDAACAMLESRGVSAARADLEHMANRFPWRTRRSFVSDEALATTAAPDSRPDEPLMAREAAAAAERASGLLRAALDALPPQDHLIVRMLVADGFTIARIARALSLEQKPLYRRVERLLAELRSRLERDGLSARDVSGVLEHRGFDSAAANDTESDARVRLFSRDASSVHEEAR
jgi:RNA polymerase sigma factor for flagellar operon FliA